jgi:hypothetical protein
MNPLMIRHFKSFHFLYPVLNPLLVLSYSSTMRRNPEDLKVTMLADFKDSFHLPLNFHFLLIDLSLVLPESEIGPCQMNFPLKTKAVENIHFQLLRMILIGHCTVDSGVRVAVAFLKPLAGR